MKLKQIMITIKPVTTMATSQERTLTHNQR